MPDGSITERETLPRDGVHFLRRRRSRTIPLSKCTLDIFRTEGRQAVRVGTTDESDIGRAEIALKKFVATDMEAKLAERKDGKTRIIAKDMLLFEAMTGSLLQRGDQSPTGRALQIAATLARKAWPDNPYVSELTGPQQRHFVKVLRSMKIEEGDKRKRGKIGDRRFNENSILNRMCLVWAMFSHMVKEGKLKHDCVPPMLGKNDWAEETMETPVNYTMEQMAALFNDAGTPDPVTGVRCEERWRLLITQTNTIARPDAANKLTCAQIDRRLRLVYLNPVGRRITKKRRPTIPLTPTFEAELVKWAATAPGLRDRIVVNAKGRPMRQHTYFKKMARDAGLPEGTAMMIRHFMRTWLVTQTDVVPAQADAFIGHADENTSTTSRKHYIHTEPNYLSTCVAAIERLFDQLQLLVHYPLGNRSVPGRDPMRHSLQFNTLLSNCLASTQPKVLIKKVTFSVS